MTKKNVLTAITDSVFVIAFNVLFFVNGGIHHVPSTWICYGFLHFAYLMVLLTPIFETKGKTAYLSKLTTYSISFLYFFIELVLAITVFEKEMDKTKVIISVQTIFTSLYFILLLSNLLANDSIAKKQERHDIENDFIKTISSRVKYIENIATDSNLKNKINNLYYSMHSSPIRTSTKVAAYETKIYELLDNLESLVDNDKFAALEKVREIEQMLTKRNFMLRARE